MLCDEIAGHWTRNGGCLEGWALDVALRFDVIVGPAVIDRDSGRLASDLDEQLLWCGVPDPIVLPIIKRCFGGKAVLRSFVEWSRGVSDSHVAVVVEGRIAMLRSERVLAVEELRFFLCVCKLR